MRFRLEERAGTATRCSNDAADRVDRMIAGLLGCACRVQEKLGARGMLVCACRVQEKLQDTDELVHGGQRCRSDI